MNVLDLFSGIGGFSLGLERAGMRTVAFCEIDPFCRRVLAKHWPSVPCYDDVRELTAERLRADGISVDVICGGFPCQDISLAGKNAGLDGARSGLWSEYARIIGDVGPRFVVVENVAILVSRGLDRVLRDLAAIGYDAEWHCIPASAIGAPHQRDRIWIVAYPNDGFHPRGLVGRRPESPPAESKGRDPGKGEAPHRERIRIELSAGREVLADAAGERCGEVGQLRCDEPAQWTTRGSEDVSHADRPRLSLAWSESLGENGQQVWRVPPTGDWWSIEPDVGRVAHGVPGRMDRLRQLGNSVVPQIPEIIGRAIMNSVYIHQREANT